MNEKTIDYLIIKKPERTPKEQLKWQIESDIFYLFECKHCRIVTLIEEAIDNFKDDKHPDEIAVKCPVCHTDNLIPKGQTRVKLRLEKIMAPNEVNPYYERVAKKMRIKGFDH